MRPFRLRRPSPALVVSLLALTVALGGTSYAAFSIPNNSVGTKQLKTRAVTNKKIANGAVGTAKFTASAFINNAGHANTANSANTATTAGSAPPRVYGFITSTGTIDTNRSRNIAAVSNISPGAWCVTPTASSGVSPATEYPVTSGDEVSGAGLFHVTQFRNLSTPCTTSAGNGWRIDTYFVDGGTPTFSNFAFSIIAP